MNEKVKVICPECGAEPDKFDNCHCTYDEDYNEVHRNGGPTNDK